MTVVAPERRSPGRVHRVVVAAGAGVVATLLVAVGAHLFGTPLGVADNGDGYRLYCGAGLSPLTVDRLASWKGGVVTTFATVPTTCDDPVPSSALVILRVASATASGTWSLATLGWWYAALVGVVVAVAAAAASASSWWRAAVLAIPVAPLAIPTFSRFVVSTYGEPAVLLGMVAVGCGVAALLATRPEHRVSRAVALALTAAGGLVGVAAKVAYLPVLAAAVLTCAVVAVGVRGPVEAPRGAGVRRRLAGPAVAVVTVVIAVPLVLAALERQNVEYEAVNTHNLVFTLVLRELGPAATGPLGLPPEAAAVTGNGYFNGPPRPDAAWWREAVVDRPAQTRRRAYEVLAAHPAAMVRALGIGLQATTRADLPYLSSAPADPSVVSPGDGDPGWSGAQQPDLQDVLDASRRPPWIPSALVLLAAVAVATIPWQRRVSPAASRFSTAAGLATATAVALVAIAVLGDGYVEVFKHVWPATYLLVVTGTCLTGTVVATAAGLLPRRRR